MYFCRIVEIWFLFLSLPRPTSTQEDQSLPSNSAYLYEGNKKGVDQQDIKHFIRNNNIGVFSNANGFKSSKRREREMQEYGDYREEKEMPNLSKAGLSLFSWWNSMPDAKRLKNGTFPPLANDTTSSDDLEISVDPAMISTDVAGANITDISNVTNSTIQSTTSVPTYLTTCYTITLECSPLTIGSPITCADLDASNKTTAFGTTVTKSRTKATVTVSTSTVGSSTASGKNITDAARPLKTTSGGRNVTVLAAGNVTDSTDVAESGTDFVDITTVLSETAADGAENQTDASSSPTIVNIVGAGMILPVYQLPVTQVIVVNTLPPKPQKTKPKQGMNYNEIPLMSKLKIDRKPCFDENKVNLNFTNNKSKLINRILLPEKAFSKNTILPQSVLVTTSASQHDTIEMINFASINTVLSNFDKVNFELTEPTNQKFLKNQIGSIKLTNGILEETSYPYKSGLKQKDEHHYNIFNRKMYGQNNEVKEVNIIRQLQDSKQLSVRRPDSQTSSTFINQELDSFKPNDTYVYDISQPKTNNYVEKSHSWLADKITTIDSENKSNRREFIKYNDTYLSQKSNISTNLVAICKNITCQGNDYLAQCCSRVCAPGRCKGEDFSYLHPIPGDTTTSTVKNCFNPYIINSSIGSNLLYTKCGHLVVNCSCRPKQNSRVVRENDINDFVKFQLMHGMTAPDGKELMNALKEANLQMQKVNREFHANDPAHNPFNYDGQLTSMLGKHSLPNKIPECLVSPLNANNILDELRATISNSFLRDNIKGNPVQKEKYRMIRNQGLHDQLEGIRESNIILEKLKKESELELRRLSLLKTRRREQEALFNQEREKSLKELKTIQELIHREFESRTPIEHDKLDFTGTQSLVNNQPESGGKESSYSKLVHHIENAVKDKNIDNLIFKRFSAGNTSNSIKFTSRSDDAEKFPELEIKNSMNKRPDDTFLVLNIGTDKDRLTENQRTKRENFNKGKNKSINENTNKSIFPT